MSDNDATRSAPPDGAATRSQPAAPLPSSGGTISHIPAQPGASATLSVAGGPHAISGDAPEVPGYELSEELGRGAMGVVYKARNLRLNRTVALKMVLGDHRADSRRLIRFLAEAEAVAAVKHPHVVQVFEFGDAAGRPFIAFEYLAGGKLTSKLGSPLPPKDAAQLLSQIARGVAAAHDQGIVHRDLKPGNVLFDESGVPKVTDFGLAKRSAGSDLTATQAVMGTPAYMAPEQASGSARFVGPQADVWSLGVILYEASTGTRPFDAEDVQGLLAQVMLADPLPPRKRESSVPRDLELMCLKCLAKLPHERYPTAKELADDLDRFARGEPISVRPAGPLERSYKWVKRNKVVSGAMTAVSLALVVSLGFGLEAQKQKTEAESAAERERGEATRADRERDDAIKARNDLNNKNDELNDALARSLLGPISAGNRTEKLTQYEISTFWELRCLRNKQVRERFLELATRTPLSCDQLTCRAEYALQAAIALDPELRTFAEQLFAERINSPSTSEQHRVALALACRHLETRSPHLAVRIAEILIEAMGHAKDAESLRPLAAGLASVLARMPPSIAVTGCDKAAVYLVEVMKIIKPEWTELFDPQHEHFLDEFAATLEIVMTRMEQTRAANLLSEAIKKQSLSAYSLRLFAELLTKVVVRINPDKAHDFLELAADHMATQLIDLSKDYRALGSAPFQVVDYRDLTDGLALLLTRMAPAKSAAMRSIIVPQVSKNMIRVDMQQREKMVQELTENLQTRPREVLSGSIRTGLPLLHPPTDTQSERLPLLYLAPRPKPVKLEKLNAQPPQELVELLKHPFCVGEARRAVLDALEFTYKRPFKDQWDFVEYAQKHQPQLDLLSPPRRPEPRP